MGTKITLMVLGRPVTFTQNETRIAACKTHGKNPDGSWPRGRCKGTSAGPRITAPKPGVAPKPKSPARQEKRRTEVAEILKKEEHHGTPASEIPKILEALGEQNGWKANLGDMSLTYRGEHGDAKISLHPDGYRVTAPANPDSGLPAIDEVVKDINLARTAVLKNAGAPRTRKPATKGAAPAGKPAAAKKTAAPKGKGKGKAPSPAGTRSSQEAEAARLLKKPSHHGTLTGRIIAIFRDVAERLGWKLDEPVMKATFTNRNGTGEVELVPQGYKTTVTRTGKQPQSRIWKNPADAFSHVSSQLHRSELPGG